MGLTHSSDPSVSETPAHQTTEIRWLHLSDFHLRTSQGWSQDVVLNSLLEDIRTQYSGQNRPDLLFITGDVAFSGKHEEYVLAEQFIRKLQEVTSLSSDRLFIVPGNHDIDRTIEEDAFVGSRIKLTDAIEVDRFFSSEGRRRTLLRRQEAFRHFANRVAPADHEGYGTTSFAHSKSTTIGPVNVKVVLLDSAWLSDGGPSDIGSLLVGERQVIDACGSAEAYALTFALLHHPLSWLRQFEQVTIENLLIERVNLLLLGHVHSFDMRSIEMLERRLTVFTAGAAFETRTSDNSYGVGSIDLATGVGKSLIHRYIQSTKRWQASPPQSWRLLSKPNPNVPLDEAVAVFAQSAADFVYYGASLLAGYSTEVPCYIDGVLVCLNFEAEVREDHNPIGQIVTNMRHLFYWKDAWHGQLWDTELARLIEQFNTKIKELEGTSTNVASFLAQQEHRCRQTAEVITGHPQYKTSPLIAHVTDLQMSGDWSKVLQVVDRWRSENVLREEEDRELSRIEVQALLETGRIPDAIAKVKILAQDKGADAEDFHLAAASYYVAKDYSTAASYLHKALDHNIAIDSVRRLALLISGRAGDPTLRKRVT